MACSTPTRAVSSSRTAATSRSSLATDTLTVAFCAPDSPAGGAVGTGSGDGVPVGAGGGGSAPRPEGSPPSPAASLSSSQMAETLTSAGGPPVAAPTIASIASRARYPRSAASPLTSVRPASARRRFSSAWDIRSTGSSSTARALPFRLWAARIISSTLPEPRAACGSASSATSPLESVSSSSRASPAKISRSCWRSSSSGRKARLTGPPSCGRLPAGAPRR